jgi:hypothetical protein
LIALQVIGRIKIAITMLPKVIAEFFEQAGMEGPRSTVLQPLRTYLGICTAGLLAAIYLRTTWAAIVFAWALVLGVVFYLGTYTYCLLKDRDALRSEKYSIQKLELGRGFICDSLPGSFKAKDEKRTLPMDPGRDLAGHRERDDS